MYEMTIATNNLWRNIEPRYVIRKGSQVLHVLHSLMDYNEIEYTYAVSFIGKSENYVRFTCRM
jgi:hypothetical protein